MKRGEAAALLWAALALPAHASTTPVLGLAPGERALAVSLPAVAFDAGVRPGLALGGVAAYYYYLTHVGARATWTLGAPAPGLRLGALLGVGGGTTTFERASGYGYVTPQAVAAWTLGPLVLRGALGPGFALRQRPVPASDWYLDLAPFGTLELAVPLGAGELTLGGNALVGWRTGI